MDTNDFPVEPPAASSDDLALPDIVQAGLAHHRTGRIDEAEKAYVGFLEQHPGHPQTLSFLGAIYATREQTEVAIWLLSTAIQGNPSLAWPRYCLGTIHARQGDNEQAIASLVLAASLGYKDADKLLELLFNSTGNQGRTTGHRALAGYYRTHNQPDRAIENASQALDLDADDLRNWQTLRQCLTDVQFTSAIDPDLVSKISAAFHREGLDYRQMVRAAISAMKHDVRIQPLLQCTSEFADSVDCLCSKLASEELEPVCTHPLLTRVMQVAVLTDIQLEMALTALRTALLQVVTDAGNNGDNYMACLSIMSSMACQCFLNEYIWSLTKDELGRVDMLDINIKTRIDKREPVPASWIAILGTYRPLHEASYARQLADASWPNELAALIHMQLTEPATEAAIRPTIPSASAVNGEVTERVRLHYEENPFPRWAAIPMETAPISLDEHMQQLFPYLDEEDMKMLKHPDQPEILVAGCGTGLIPNYIAANITGASVTAVDLSLSSLSYAARKSRESGIHNIEYLHGDILRLPELQRTFDHINCYGVLHHMEDTQRGWETLVRCARPGGTMHIGLYSKIARRPVTRAHEFIRERGYQPLPGDMRRFRYDVLQQKHDTLLQTLPEAQDFYSMSELRDLVFHSQEHFHTLTEVKEMIETLGLVFLGFVLKDPTSAVSYRSAYPQDPEMLSLENWTKFEEENPKTFASIYDFWVYKKNEVIYEVGNRKASGLYQST